MTESKTATAVGEWAIEGVRRCLSRTLGLRHDWDRVETVTYSGGVPTIRLITALDAAHRVGLGLIAIFPQAESTPDGHVDLTGQPTFAILRGGQANGSVVTLSDAAEEWIDTSPADEDTPSIVDGSSVLQLLSRAGWATPGAVAVHDSTINETHILENISETFHLNGETASTESVTRSPANGILCIQHSVRTGG